MKPIWWTCGCGKRQMSQRSGRPQCSACGKPAQFRVDPPAGQAAMDFGAPCRGDEDPDR